MKILAEILTHKAVKENGVINIYEKGIKFAWPFNEEDVLNHPDWFKDRLLHSIPLECEDDVFAYMENYEETNRIYRNNQ